MCDGRRWRFSACTHYNYTTWISPWNVLNNACLSSPDLLQRARNPSNSFMFYVQRQCTSTCATLKYEVILTNISYQQVLTVYLRQFSFISIQKAIADEWVVSHNTYIIHWWVCAAHNKTSLGVFVRSRPIYFFKVLVFLEGNQSVRVRFSLDTKHFQKFSVSR